MTIRQMKFAWKYRRPLWKYRKLVARRREIAGVALAGTVILSSILFKRGAAKRLTAAPDTQAA